MASKSYSSDPVLSPDFPATDDTLTNKNYVDNYFYGLPITASAPITGQSPILNGTADGWDWINLPMTPGTVTSVSVTSANGVSAIVTNPTTTPNLQFSLGAITPSSVSASGTISGSNLSGTNTGDQTIILTGDVTGSGTGSFSTVIANNAITTVKVNNSAITYAKMQNEVASTLLGNPTALSAAPSEITLNATLSFSGSSLQRSALTGDVTASAGSNSLAISTNAVTYSKFQQALAGNVVLANPTAGVANYSEVALALNQLLGRGSSGNIAAITLGGGLSMSGTTLSSTGSGFSNFSINVQTFNSSGTYTPTANMVYCQVMASAGGGGGGGASGGVTGNAAGGGGGSGECGISYFSAATIGASKAVTIGAGGAAGSSAGGNGGLGGTTSFGALMSLSGGGGGVGSTNHVATLSVSFGANSTPIGVTPGTINIPGNAGTFGLSDGVAGGISISGTGGASPLFGGSVHAQAVTANNGSGGSGGKATTVNTAGFTGSAGVIYVVEYILS